MDSAEKETTLAAIAPYLKKIAYGESLDVGEARMALNIIGDQDLITDPVHSDGLYMLALTLGIMAKGPTADELFGFVQSISDNSIRFAAPDLEEKMIDISGTGGDRIKTFNVGTVASFVLAAGGLFVAKQATRGYTGFTGSANIFQELGLDPFSLSADRVVDLLRKTGMVALYTPAYSRGLKNRIDFLTKLKNIGLAYPTPWHLVSWVYSPFALRYRLYGVFRKDYVMILAELFQKLGYERVLVCHGLDGLDEVSNVGATYVAELRNKTIEESEVQPEDLGISRARAEDIQTLSASELIEFENPNTDSNRKASLAELGRQRNIETCFRILLGKERGAKLDLVLVNAGAAFYVAGVRPSIREGVNFARELIEDGKAQKKLEEFVGAIGKSALLHSWRNKI